MESYRMKKYIVLFALLLFQVTSRAQVSTNGYGPQKGFKAFADVTGGLGLGLRGFNRAAISATAGYQFNPHLFAGAGASFDFNTKIKYAYVDVRGTLDRQFSPVIDVRAGMNIDDCRFYASPTFGCRYAIENGHAITLGIGIDYTYMWFIEKVPFTYYDEVYKETKTLFDKKRTLTDNIALCLRLSYEF